MGLVARLYPLALLLIVGMGLGSVFSLSLAAVSRGVPVAGYGFWYVLGSALIVLLVKVLASGGPVRWRRHANYYLVVGLVSVTFPYGMTFFVVPRIGVGVAAILFALVPILTSAWAWLLGVSRLSLHNAGALMLGLMGAAVIIHSRYALESATAGFWTLVALSIPVCLAFGNVYRSWKWPEHATPLQLSTGMLFFAAALFLPIMLLEDGLYIPNPAEPGGGFVLLQIAIGAMTFLLYFVLQRVGGPIFMGQIGYVVTATGLFTGIMFFDERYDAITWFGAAVVLLGLCLSRPQR